MKNKDLILITAYTPDLNRKNILLEALKSIDKTKFDIMISSHSSIPEEAFEYCDFFIFDKKNTLLFDNEHKLTFWFSCDAFKVFTTEYKDYNHIIAAGSLTINGLSAAKEFGYNKVHWFDYDTIFVDDSELVENSILLDSYSIIWYNHPDLLTFSGMSFNLSKIDQDWFNTSSEVFYSFLNQSETKTLEFFNYFYVIFFICITNASGQSLFIPQQVQCIERSSIGIVPMFAHSFMAVDIPSFSLIVFVIFITTSPKINFFNSSRFRVSVFNIILFSRFVAFI